MPPETIIEVCCGVFAVSPAELLSRARQRHIAYARQAAMLALRLLTDRSLAAIGAELGGRDHSTVLYGIAAAETRAACEPRYRRQLDQVLGALRGAA